MNLIWLDSLLKVDDNHPPGFVNWNPFEIQFEKWEGKYHIARFCIFANVENLTMSKSCRNYSWNFLDKYGNTRRICFTNSFAFGYRERELSTLLI